MKRPFHRKHFDLEEEGSLSKTSEGEEPVRKSSKKKMSRLRNALETQKGTLKVAEIIQPYNF